MHLFPQIAGAVLQIVSEQAPTTWVRHCGRARPPSNRFSDRKGLLLDILSTGVRRRAAALGIRCNPAFAGTYDFGGGKDFSVLFPRFLERLPEGGLIMCHPGFVDDELEQLDPLTTLRAAEYDFLAGDHFPAACRPRRRAGRPRRPAVVVKPLMQAEKFWRGDTATARRAPYMTSAGTIRRNDQ